MDNLTHAFTAITCTHAVSRERPSGLTLAAAVLAANVQDLDWLPVLSLRPESIEAHRGTMHSLLVMPLLAMGAALGCRFVARRRGNDAPSPPFLPMLGICLVAAALLVEGSLREGASEVPARVRAVLAVLWLACLVGPPIITRLVRLPLVPLAVLLLGWVVFDTWRAAQTRA